MNVNFPRFKAVFVLFFERNFILQIFGCFSFNIVSLFLLLVPFLGSIFLVFLLLLQLTSYSLVEVKSCCSLYFTCFLSIKTHLQMDLFLCVCYSSVPSLLNSPSYLLTKCCLILLLLFHSVTGEEVEKALLVSLKKISISELVEQKRVCYLLASMQKSPP